VKCHEPFADHPQFALLRRWPPDQQLSAGAVAAVKTSSVASLDPSSGTWTDKTQLKFSHQEHLASLIRRWKHGTDEAILALPTQLNCADYHQPDANGQYMQPIVYEKHCRDCHPLRFSSKLDLGDVLNSNDQRHDLPHETLEIVHGVMRERLIAYARRHPDEVLTSDADSPSRLPNRTSRTPTPKQEWDWVNEEYRILASAIFRTSLPGDNVPSSNSEPSSERAVPPSNACLKCHEPGSLPVAKARRAATGFTIAPPGIPTRWLPHSRFRHDRHLKMGCVDCHQATSGNVLATTATSQASTLLGTTVKDILMPPIGTCQTCHGATGGSPVKIRTRKNCTECHQFHHVQPAKATDGRAPH